jgi:threonine/homoserine/homoserine lactone efflux protein
MGPIWEGVLLGLTLAFFFGFGPALFALIQTSIHRGLISGFFLAIGIFLSDIVLVALCFLGVIQIISDPTNHLIFGIVSSVILIIFGIVTFRKKVMIKSDEDEDDDNKPGFMTYIMKGFFLNIANPFVWIFWMGVVVAISANYPGDPQSIILFLAGTLITVIATDMLKCFGSFKIKRYLTPTFIMWINRIAGIGLVLFGIYLLIRTFTEF